MKTKNLSANILFIACLFPIAVFGQSKWTENDDMYFSKIDREKLQVANSYSNESLTTNKQSEYFNNHNFNSPTIQSATVGSPTIQTANQLEMGQPEDANNQYFISDYSLHNQMDNEEIRFSEINPNANRNFNSGVNVNFMVGSAFGPSWGAWGRHNAFMDPFSPFNDPFWGMGHQGFHHNPWAFGGGMGMMGMHHNPWVFGGGMGMMGMHHNPWAFGRGMGMGMGWNGGMGMGGWNNPWAFGGMGMMGQNGFNNFAGNRQPEVRYRNGRRVISGSRGTTNRSRSASQVANTNRAIKNSGPNSTVSPNGRSRTSSQVANTNRTTQSRRASATISPNERGRIPSQVANTNRTTQSRRASAVNSNGRSNTTTNARMSRGSHQKYPNSFQNRRPSSSNAHTNRVNTHRTNTHRANSSWNNNSNASRSSNFQRSGSSSGRSSSFSRPSSGGSRSMPSGGSRGSSRGRR